MGYLSNFVINTKKPEIQQKDAGHFLLGNVIGVAKKQFIILTRKIMSNSVGLLKKVGMWGGPAIVRITERRGGVCITSEQPHFHP